MERGTSKPNTQHARKTPWQRSKRVSLFGWWWELGAILVSLTSMSLILTILCYMNGQLLSHWRLPIQLNSLIAVFSTFARSALMLALAEGLSQLKWNHFEKQHSTLDRLQIYDEASRGPWGAFMYLFKMRKDVRAIAALGAVLTVLALAFEPFTQQIIEFSPRKTLSSNATAYVLSAETFKIKSGLGIRGKDTPRLALVQTIVELLSNPSTEFTSHFVCPGADCSMPTHWSLGACASCDAPVILNSLQMGCTYSYIRNGSELLFSNTSMQSANNLNVNGFKSIAQNAGADHYLGPSDHYFARCSNMSSISTNFTTVRPKDGIYTKNKTEIYWPRETYSWDANSTGLGEKVDTSVDIVVVDIRALTKLFPDYDDLDEWNGLETDLHRCRIKLCGLKTSNATIRNGELKAEEHDLALRLLDDGRDSNNYTATYGSNDTTHGPAEEIVFRMDSWQREYFGRFVAQVMDRLINMEATTDSLAEMRIDEVAIMLNTAINAFMRSPQNMQRSRIPGAAYTTETYVQVRWEWATLPAFIVLSAVTFLVLTMWESSRSEQLFKTSALTGYFYNVEGELCLGDIPSAARKDEKHDYNSLLERGKKIKVQLKKREDGALVFSNESSKERSGD